MKVLLLNDRESGGGAEVVYQQTYSLLKARQPNIKARKSSPYGGLCNQIVNGFGLFNLSYSFRILWLVISFRPDIVHVHNYIYAISPCVLQILKITKNLLGFSVVHTAHDFHLVCPNTGLLLYRSTHEFESCVRCSEDGRWSNIVKRNCDRRGFAFSLVRYLRHLLCYDWLHLEKVFDLIICPSEFLAVKVRRRYPDSFVVVLRNPAFVGRYKAMPTPSERSDAQTLAYFGRLQPEKGICLFIETEYDALIHPKFLIYGEGIDKDKIHRLIKKKGLEKNICLMGAVSHAEAVRAMEAIDIVVLPSLCYENCPLVICDALQMGKEVVSYNRGGVAELLSAYREGDTAFLSTEVYRDRLISIYHEATSGCRMTEPV